MFNKIRTRIAPSPTGSLHLGTARTALFNFLFAKKHKGKFILRIEDTDLQRSDPAFEKDIIEGLKWLGLKWDKGPYYQSGRLKSYKKYLKKLLKEKKAFWCPHTQEQLLREKNEQMERRESPRHFCSFREDSADHGIIRLKNDFKGRIEFDDLIRGNLSFEAEFLVDISLAKALDIPLYNFAVVVDDQEMKISHVIRGEDHISNTPKQILIQRALGFQTPKYAHLPLILGRDRSKLSKRHGAVSINDYKRQGYLKEALLNFLLLLGWHPAPEPRTRTSSIRGRQARYGAGPRQEKEIFSFQEMLKEFSLERVQKAGAVFDIEKLNWLNSQHIRRLPLKDLSGRLLEYLPENWKMRAKENSDFWQKTAALERERLTRLVEIKELVWYFFEEPEYPKELLKWKTQPWEEVRRHLIKISETISQLPSKKFSQEELRKTLMPYADEKGRGEVLWPFRVALTGRRASPDPFEIAEVLGREKTLERVKRAIELSQAS